MSARSLLALVLVLASGCALSARNARSSVDRARLDHAKELTAKVRAPVAYERYERASRAARATKDEGARGDRAAESRLWLELAIAESESLVMAEQRLKEEQSLAVLDVRITELAAEEDALAREAELRAAQGIARKEADRALARARAKPSLRVKLSRDDAKSAAEALIGRADLLALTLETLGASAPGVARLRAKLNEARALTARDPEAALVQADQGLFHALTLLAAVRASDGAPSEAERASLHEALALAGARTVRGDQGLSGVVEPAFAAGGLIAPAARVIERLCALAKAHPRGPVELRVHAPNAHEGEARLRATRERLAKAGCAGERFRLRTTADVGDALEASWLAY